jgi:hypothetical protein
MNDKQHTSEDNFDNLWSAFKKQIRDNRDKPTVGTAQK